MQRPDLYLHHCQQMLDRMGKCTTALYAEQPPPPPPPLFVQPQPAPPTRMNEYGGPGSGPHPGSGSHSSPPRESDQEFVHRISGLTRREQEELREARHIQQHNPPHRPGRQPGPEYADDSRPRHYSPQPAMAYTPFPRDSFGRPRGVMQTVSMPGFLHGRFGAGPGDTPYSPYGNKRRD